MTQIYGQINKINLSDDKLSHSYYSNKLKCVIINYFWVIHNYFKLVKPKIKLTYKKVFIPSVNLNYSNQKLNSLLFFFTLKWTSSKNYKTPPSSRISNQIETYSNKKSPNKRNRHSSRPSRSNSFESRPIMTSYSGKINSFSRILISTDHKVNLGSKK